jgi:opacity protein-like surface antigen
MRAKSFLLAAACAVAVMSAGAGAAFAGEVQGAPGTPGVAFSGSGNRTGAPAHSNSICSFNGLNDMNPAQGPINSIVQTPHTQGSPGDAGHGTCAGGTNPENPPAP